MGFSHNYDAFIFLINELLKIFKNCKTTKLYLFPFKQFIFIVLAIYNVFLFFLCVYHKCIMSCIDEILKVLSQVKSQALQRW